MADALTRTAASARPAVTVVMPAYNAERYISEAIASVEAQTFSNWELIVVDDGSHDDTARIATQFAAHDTRIRVISLPENMGVANARNRAIDEAQGGRVAFLDSDDLWEPEKLQYQLDLAEHSEAEIVYSSYDLIDDAGNNLMRRCLAPTEITFERMLFENVIGCSACLVDSELVRAHPFSTKFYHEDYLLWALLIRDGHIARGCPKILMHHRQIKGSRSSRKLASARQRWKIYREGLGLSLPKSSVSLFFYALSGLRKYYL